MLATDLAYLAGMIDGDGHITIRRRRWKTDAAGRLLDGVQHDGFPEVSRG